MGENIRDRLTRFNARQDNSIVLHAVPGHFATSQSHINYYIDMTSLKSRSREAREVARFLQSASMHRIDMVDTIVCMDGTEVIGAFLAEELEKNHISIANMHETIYVVSPDKQCQSVPVSGEHPPGGGRKTCTASDGQHYYRRDGPQESGVYRVLRWNCGGSHSDFLNEESGGRKAGLFGFYPGSAGLSGLRAL